MSHRSLSMAHENQFALTNCCFITLRVRTAGNYTARIVQFCPETTGFPFKVELFKSLNDENSAKTPAVILASLKRKTLIFAPRRNTRYWLTVLFPSLKRSANIFSLPSGEKNKTVFHTFCPIMKLLLLVSAARCIAHIKVVSAESGAGVPGGESTWQRGGGRRGREMNGTKASIRLGLFPEHLFMFLGLPDCWTATRQS